MDSTAMEYTYIRTVGEGAYGDVWLTQRKNGAFCAVKVFKAAHEDPEIKALAKREARILQSLQHVNIVKLIDAFKSKSGRVYLVFEYVDKNIFSELDMNPYGLTSRTTKLVTWQLLHAAAYLHERKVVHRDIKPANILMTTDGVVKLCDFGFARTTRCGPREVAPMSTYVVTRWYRAPEVLVSDAYGPSADIWSLGCTIAEVATGRPLFPGKSTADQLWRIMRCLGPLAPQHVARLVTDERLRGVTVPALHKNLRQRLPEMEARLFQVVEACLHPDPLMRPTAAEVLQMPYFWDVPGLVVGSPLEQLYPSDRRRPLWPSASQASVLRGELQLQQEWQLAQQAQQRMQAQHAQQERAARERQREQAQAQPQSQAQAGPGAQDEQARAQQAGQAGASVEQLAIKGSDGSAGATTAGPGPQTGSTQGTGGRTGTGGSSGAATSGGTALSGADSERQPSDLVSAAAAGSVAAAPAAGAAAKDFSASASASAAAASKPSGAGPSVVARAVAAASLASAAAAQPATPTPTGPPFAQISLIQAASSLRSSGSAGSSAGRQAAGGSLDMASAFDAAAADAAIAAAVAEAASASEAVVAAAAARPEPQAAAAEARPRPPAAQAAAAGAAAAAATGVAAAAAPPKAAAVEARPQTHPPPPPSPGTVPLPSMAATPPAEPRPQPPSLFQRQSHGRVSGPGTASTDRTGQVPNLFARQQSQGMASSSLASADQQQQQHRPMPSLFQRQSQGRTSASGAPTHCTSLAGTPQQSGWEDAGAEDAAAAAELEAAAAAAALAGTSGSLSGKGTPDPEFEGEHSPMHLALVDVAAEADGAAGGGGVSGAASQTAAAQLPPLAAASAAAAAAADLACTISRHASGSNATTATATAAAQQPSPSTAAGRPPAPAATAAEAALAQLLQLQGTSDNGPNGPPRMRARPTASCPETHVETSPTDHAAAAAARPGGATAPATAPSTAVAVAVTSAVAPARAAGAAPSRAAAAAGSGIVAAAAARAAAVAAEAEDEGGEEVDGLGELRGTASRPSRSLAARLGMLTHHAHHVPPHPHPHAHHVHAHHVVGHVPHDPAALTTWSEMGGGGGGAGGGAGGGDQSSAALGAHTSASGAAITLSSALPAASGAYLGSAAFLPRDMGMGLPGGGGEQWYHSQALGSHTFGSSFHLGGGGGGIGGGGGSLAGGDPCGGSDSRLAGVPGLGDAALAAAVLAGGLPSTAALRRAAAAERHAAAMRAAWAINHAGRFSTSAVPASGHADMPAPGGAGAITDGGSASSTTSTTVLAAALGGGGGGAVDGSGPLRPLAATLAQRAAVGSRIYQHAARAWRVSQGGVGGGGGNFAFPPVAGGGGGGGVNSATGNARIVSARLSCSGTVTPLSLDPLGSGHRGSHASLMSYDTIPLADLNTPRNAPDLPSGMGVGAPLPHRRPPMASSPWQPPSAADTSDSLFLLPTYYGRAQLGSGLPRTPTGFASDQDRPSPPTDNDRPSPPTPTDTEAGAAMGSSRGSGNTGLGVGMAALWSGLWGRFGRSVGSLSSVNAGAGVGGGASGGGAAVLSAAANASDPTSAVAAGVGASTDSAVHVSVHPVGGTAPGGAGGGGGGAAGPRPFLRSASNRSAVNRGPPVVRSRLGGSGTWNPLDPLGPVHVHGGPAHGGNSSPLGGRIGHMHVQQLPSGQTSAHGTYGGNNAYNMAYGHAGAVLHTHNSIGAQSQDSLAVLLAAGVQLSPVERPVGSSLFSATANTRSRDANAGSSQNRSNDAAGTAQTSTEGPAVMMLNLPDEDANAAAAGRLEQPPLPTRPPPTQQQQQQQQQQQPPRMLAEPDVGALAAAAGLPSAASRPAVRDGVGSGVSGGVGSGVGGGIGNGGSSGVGGGSAAVNYRPGSGRPPPVPEHRHSSDGGSGSGGGGGGGGGSGGSSAAALQGQPAAANPAGSATTSAALATGPVHAATMGTADLSVVAVSTPASSPATTGGMATAKKKKKKKGLKKVWKSITKALGLRSGGKSVA
ncbi:hypothetical protein HYH03_018349 [Edaphochlamys debaryana]|uniref:cyclin-dependent kinase n=1 Tax=Edaphochlamys debaryana TaxID=47281 RepID=A0A836BN80_9CHLO|nr:hypothetical protein HYH03_018349 [Edaphochlamys debaryana]|eukprot:KAG2482755.1 hypothetical protein HYH03_018349 [Edaphochlamys debaryana]